jgi:hypothetical protein
MEKENKAGSQNLPWSKKKLPEGSLMEERKV